MTNLPLIEHVAKKGKPMIVSTGMSELEEIKETVNLIKEIKTPVALTHCVSIYLQDTYMCMVYLQKIADHKYTHFSPPI